MEYAIGAFVAAVLVMAAWAFSFQRMRRQRRVIAQALEALSQSGGVPSLDALHTGFFSPLAHSVERAGQELARLRQGMRDEAYSLKTVLESMEEGVMVVDSRHILRLVNPSFLSLFGIARSPLGMSVMASLREPELQEMVASVLQNNAPQSCEFTRQERGRIQHFAAHAVAMADASGGRNALVILRDVTRLKQLEDVRKEFVANVSHELRTPLAIFRGYVETLLDSPDMDPEDLAGILLVLKRHSDRLNALVEDLLILARLEARHEELRLERISMEPFCATIVRDWQGKAGEKEVELSLHVADALPELPADPLRLEQVFSNLLDNALKYTPRGGKISIRVQQEDGNVSISIEDTGAGIPPADLPHIFERFYRADKARAREQGGTGLGLSIVKHIVQSHGGTVRAESTHTKGTKITLTFPLNAPALSDPAA
jgi:two-component system phosphate regulon sensor histidine kinase PhoR